ncbi:hypothetical protein K501DRAFT_266485 [Backusella circina FSU 941]|nr:hypothetical protein K501DRAFT_266485 [Backusella circina FSU 941]
MSSPSFLQRTHQPTFILQQSCSFFSTIVIRHPDSETGFPLAYCFTNDHSTTPLVEFLTFLSVLGMIPNKITIGVSKTELAAIEMVFPTVNVQWCFFHVGRAWMQKIREYITRRHVSTADKKALQNQTVRYLKALVHERSIMLFLQLLKAFFY